MSAPGASEKIWACAETDETVVSRIVCSTGLPGPVAAALAGRGLIEPDEIDRYLNPRLSGLTDPFQLQGIREAVHRIWTAVDAGQAILVYGDYDVDGITSATLLTRILRLLGAETHPFLPHRVDDGYGLGVDPVRRCIERYRPGLIVTVDCGTNSVEAVQAARELGVDVVVTDHHEPSGERAPAHALVNPKCQEGSDLQILAGVGVAFKLCHALIKQGRADNRTLADGVDLRRYLDLVAVGTVADMVPLCGENRAIVRHGLSKLSQTEFPGLRALIRVSGIKTDRLSAYHIGFMVGPRLNAAGRLGTAETALNLLLTEDEEEAQSLAENLDAANRERQEVEKAIVEKVVDRIDHTFDPNRDFGLVVWDREWHPGVIGIVASRISRRYNRPAIVVAVDEEGIGRGSCRSLDAFNMLDGLEGCSKHLRRFGGHHMAAGLEVAEAELENFARRFNEVASASLKEEDLRPVLKVTAWVDLGDMDLDLLPVLDRLGPFGMDNPRPVWASRRVRVVGAPRKVGKDHLKLTLASGSSQFGAIFFGAGDREVPGGAFDVAYYAELDNYRGNHAVQLVLQDFRPSTD